MKRNAKQTFFKGTIILMLSTVIVKILGALFKIPLAGILGGEGMGYFMTGYSIFAPVSAVALGGITVSVSKTVSGYNSLGRYKDSSILLRISIIIFTTIGAVVGVCLYYGADYIGNAINNPLSIQVVKSMCPAVTLCFISSVLRGYFEGCKNMYPTAISQVVEAFIKLICGYCGAVLAVRIGTEQYVENSTIFGIYAPTLSSARELLLPTAAAWAAMGVSISTMAGLLILALGFRRFNSNSNRNIKSYNTSTTPIKSLLSDLFKTATPAALSAITANIPGIVDLATIINCLKSAVEKSTALFNINYSAAIKSGIDLAHIPNFLYGAYTGMALSVVNIIPAFTSPIGINALPLISEAWTSGNRVKLKEHMDEILKLTSIIAMPAGLGISIVARPVLLTLFSSRSNDAEIAAVLLSYLGIGAIFMALSIPITSMLQGIGRADVPVKIMLIGGLVKFTLNYTLISIPKINILGAVISTIISSVIVFLLGIFLLLYHSQIKINAMDTFIKPLFSAIFCTLTAWMVMDFLDGIFRDIIVAMLAAIAGGLIYLVFIVLTGLISMKELKKLSFFRNSKKALEKKRRIG